MKKVALIFVFITVLVMTGCLSVADRYGPEFASSSQSQNGPVITITNNTGQTCYFLQFSSVTAKDWGDDKLGETSVLANGRGFRTRLPEPLSVQNRYDFRMIDENGDVYEKRDVLLKENINIIFTIEDYSHNYNDN
ncbi:MAG: hypothetical protein LBI28_06995 [Treponema sp.]|jgi:uncharacterized protein YceK|nr:hypothetical protein [Treponema sp.]